MPGTSFFHQARNNAWSNHRLFGVCQKLTPRELNAKRTRFTPSILEALNQTLTVDSYYLDALLDGGHGQGDLYSGRMTPFSDMAGLAAAQRDADHKLMAFCDQLGEKDAMRDVELERCNNVVTHETVADILSHLFVYQTHQRGQVHILLATTTQSPPPMDDYHLEYDAPFPAIDFTLLRGKGA